MDRPDLPDFARSQAILIGTSRYKHLAPMPAAGNSLRGMERLLTGPLCGWPADRVKAYPDLRHAGDASEPLRLALEAGTTDVLFFYYVGHGQQTLDYDPGPRHVHSTSRDRYML